MLTDQAFDTGFSRNLTLRRHWIAPPEARRKFALPRDAHLLRSRPATQQSSITRSTSTPTFLETSSTGSKRIVNALEEDLLQSVAEFLFDFAAQ